MGTAPTPVLISAYGTGNSADGQITRDPIDDLIGAMSSRLLIYLRAKKMGTIKANFVDALGNAVVCNFTGECTYAASDANFNNHPSVTFNMTTGSNMYQMAAGGIGIGTPPVAMTNSFTVMAGIRAGNNTGGNCLYGDTAGTNGPSNLSGIYLNSSGDLVVDVGGSGGGYTGAVLLAPGTTGVIWVSFDATTSIMRAGVNNAGMAQQNTMPYNRTGASTSTVCYPFGYQNVGVAGNQSWNRWTLWNKAFLNGAVPADDAAFANLIAAYSAYI